MKRFDFSEYVLDEIEANGDFRKRVMFSGSAILSYLRSGYEFISTIFEFVQMESPTICVKMSEQPKNQSLVQSFLGSYCWTNCKIGILYLALLKLYVLLEMSKLFVIYLNEKFFSIFDWKMRLIGLSLRSNKITRKDLHL